MVLKKTSIDPLKRTAVIAFRPVFCVPPLLRMSNASPSASDSHSEDGPPDILALAEVRYSLPEMLAELRLERTTGSFAMERLNQSEIGKLFQNKQKRRAKPKS